MKYLKLIQKEFLKATEAIFKTYSFILVILIQNQAQSDLLHLDSELITKNCVLLLGKVITDRQFE